MLHISKVGNCYSRSLLPALRDSVLETNSVAF